MLDQHDGISDQSMSGALRIIDAAVVHGARLTIREHVTGGITIHEALLTTYRDDVPFTYMVGAETQRIATWKLAMALLSKPEGRHFLTKEQVTQVLDEIAGR